MSQAGEICRHVRRHRANASTEAGFTLVEVLVVVAILALTVGAVATIARPRSHAMMLKAATQLVAAKLRDTRTAAIIARRSREIRFDVNARRIWSPHDGATLKLDREILMTMTGAASGRRSKSIAAVHFFPNGSASGATLKLQAKTNANEIRINWLTGRVSTRRLR